MFNKIKKWEDSVNNAKKDVQKVWDACNDPTLRTTSIHMQKDYDEFYEVVKTILECDQNPYGFLDRGNWLETWESTSGFISTFHHSCIDDGDHCYLSDPLHGPVLVFRWMYDYDPRELYYILHPHAKDMDERMGDFYDKFDKDKPAVEYEFHTDYKRFIKELEERPEFERKRNEAFEAKLSKLKERMDD